MRIIIDLPEAQVKSLVRYCGREHVSRAEAVRRAVGQLLHEEEVQAEAPPAFGSWKHKKLDGRKYVEAIRKEWGIAREGNF